MSKPHELTMDAYGNWTPRSNPEKLIAVDLDNTIKKLVESVINFARKDFGVTLDFENDFDVWDKPIGHKLGFKTNEKYLHWAWKNEAIHWEAEPYPQVSEVLSQLKDEYEVTILTATEFPELVEPWLSRWCIPYHNIVFAKDKSQQGFDVLIDDSPSTLRQLNQLRRNVIRFFQPWNNHLDYLPTIHRWDSNVIKIIDAVITAPIIG